MARQHMENNTTSMMGQDKEEGAKWGGIEQSKAVAGGSVANQGKKRKEERGQDEKSERSSRSRAGGNQHAGKG